MGSIRQITLIALIVIAWAGRAVAADSAHAVGLVFSRSIDGTSSGNGFFVGDGTWLVTARQVIFPLRPTGLHQGEAMVTVLSPYLGEACEAKVMAQDREWDFVILRVPWKGHPALPLALESEVFAAAQVRVMGYPNIQSAQLTSETLGVSGVVVRRNMTRSLITTAPPAGPGWAGAPMLLNGSIAGCYVRTQGNGTAGAAVAVGPIRGMLEQTGSIAAMQNAAQLLAAPPQSLEATVEYLRGITASLAGDPTAALQHFQAFLKIRPGSAIGHRDAAGQLRALKRLDESQATYAKALEIAPQLVSGRVLYGQLLFDRIMPRAAEEHLRYAWQHREGSNAPAIPLCNVLRAQRKEAECLQILEQALKQNPLDGHLWNYVGQNRRAIEDHAGSASAFARAADLLGEDETSRVQAAEEFDAAGQSGRAEEQYRTLIEHNGNSPAGHYLLARLIARDRDRRDEALKHAEMALNLGDRPGAPPREIVQSLISAIRSGRVLPADELRL